MFMICIFTFILDFDVRYSTCFLIPWNVISLFLINNNNNKFILDTKSTVVNNFKYMSNISWIFHWQIFFLSESEIHL